MTQTANQTPLDFLEESKLEFEDLYEKGRRDATAQIWKYLHYKMAHMYGEAFLNVQKQVEYSPPKEPKVEATVPPEKEEKYRRKGKSRLKHDKSCPQLLAEYIYQHGQDGLNREQLHKIFENQFGFASSTIDSELGGLVKHGILRRRDGKAGWYYPANDEDKAA